MFSQNVLRGHLQSVRCVALDQYGLTPSFFSRDPVGLSVTDKPRIRESNWESFGRLIEKSGRRFPTITIFIRSVKT
jgi:hypothetical protein